MLKNFVPVIIIFVVAFTFSGCGQKQPTQKEINPTAVKVINLQLPITQYPQLVPPTISVSAMYTGANASTVDETIAQIIE